MSELIGPGEVRYEAALVAGDPFRRIDELIACDPVGPEDGIHIGASREGRAIKAFRFGSGPLRVSLLGGCHADEPVGPDLLRRLCAYLGTLGPNDSLVDRYEWWIIPHVNPDGAVRNGSWQDPHTPAYDVGSYLAGVVRELPGDDVEFGFPAGVDDTWARSENRAVLDWWLEADGAFNLHVSVHGMGFSSGPWFLIDEDWTGRTLDLRDRCAAAVEGLGYRLHDVDRGGEKGFFRIAPGFCTRPSSSAMRQHFTSLGDHETAAPFPTELDGDDPFTRGRPVDARDRDASVHHAGVGEELGPPDPVAARWKARVETWKLALARGEASAASVTRDAHDLGLEAMPIEHQMTLQWALIAAGLETFSSGSTGEGRLRNRGPAERMSGR